MSFIHYTKTALKSRKYTERVFNIRKIDHIKKCKLKFLLPTNMGLERVTGFIAKCLVVIC